MTIPFLPMTPREWNWMGCINIGLCWSCKYHTEKHSNPYYMLVRGDTNIGLVRTFREETALDDWSVDGKVWAGFILLMQNIFVIMSISGLYDLTLHDTWTGCLHICKPWDGIKKCYIDMWSCLFCWYKQCAVNCVYKIDDKMWLFSVLYM